MRAIRWDGSRVLLDPDTPAPVPQPGEALVRLTSVAAARPDRHVLEGRIEHRGVLGHQGVGVVEAVQVARQPDGRPRNDQAAWTGKRVAVWPVVACGLCGRCRGGIGAHCAHRSVFGLWKREGLFAEAAAVPLRCLVEIPKSVDDARAAWAPLVAAAAHAVSMIRIEGKLYVTVLGDGPMGLACAQLAAKLNASVRLLGHHPERFGLCEKWGVKHRHADEVGRRGDQDVVIDCTGSPDGLALAMGLVRPRGKVILKSGLGPAPAEAGRGASVGIDLSPAVAGEIELIGSSGGRLSEGLDLLERGEVDVLPFVRGRGRLEDALEALSAGGGPLKRAA